MLDPEFGFDAFALEADWTEELGAAQESLVEEPSGERELARLVDRLTVKLGPARGAAPQARREPFARAGERMGECGSVPLPLREGRGSARSGDGGGLGARAAIPLTLAVPSPAREGQERPQRLLDRPEAIDVIYATPEGMPRRFVWRRAVHDIARAEGPERIAPEWWRQPSSARLRDYYRVEDARAAATGSTARA